MRVIGRRQLGRTVGPMWKDVRGDQLKIHHEQPHHEVSGTWSTKRKDEKCVQGFRCKHEVKDHLDHVVVDAMTTLKASYRTKI